VIGIFESQRGISDVAETYAAIAKINGIDGTHRHEQRIKKL
jgi:hypothetical protein